MLVDEIRRCNETNLCWLALNALSQYEPDKYSEQIVDILRSIYHGHNEKMNTNLEIRQLAGQLLLRTDISIGDLTNLIVSRRKCVNRTDLRSNRTDFFSFLHSTNRIINSLLSSGDSFRPWRKNMICFSKISESFSTFEIIF